MSDQAISSRSRLDTARPSDTPIPMRFTLTEFSGSLGDLGTFLPLAAAMAAVNRMDLGTIFLFAGLMNIATGLLFRQPIPVQPMKAIAAVAIAEGLTPDQIAASGMAMGIIVTTLACFGAVTWIDRVVPRPVIRGIQAGVGAALIIKGLSWIDALPWLATDSVALAVLFGLFTVVLSNRRFPVILLVFSIGVLLAVWNVGGSLFVQNWSPPTLSLIVPSEHDWRIGILRGALPQLPLTLLNSVLAICALSGDLFPSKGIAPKQMAISVGLMNLASVPFGAMPMCHGAGGLAAQYRFGARTGGSVVMLGIAKILVALALGAALLPLIDAYPRSLLGVMIIFAGIMLMKPARESLRAYPSAAVMLITAIVIVVTGTLEGFIAGCVAAFILHTARHIWMKPS